MQQPLQEEEKKSLDSTEPPIEEPKKLSPEEEAVLESKRQVFRKLHNLFKDDQAIYVGADMDAVIAAVMHTYEGHSKKVKISDLEFNPEAGGNDKLKELMEILNESTVYEALNFCEVLKNAVDHETRQRTKDWKVSDLDITLL